MAIPLAAIGLGITAASTLASIGQGMFNASEQKKANEANYELEQQRYDLEREQQAYNRQKAERDFEYNKKLQETIFQREDNAVQRRVADNRLAGLSPIAGLQGASAGQALEANTPQLNQTFDTPQMSANQLNIDFGSLSQLGNQITAYEHNKDALKLQQQKLDLEKSSNEANLKQMEANLKATQLENQFKQATMESRIESSKLAPKKMEKEIAKAGVDIISQELGNELKELDKIQSKREMKEWLDNAGLREEMGNKSLEQIKVDIATKKLLNSTTMRKIGPELAILKAQKESLERENQHAVEWDNVLSDLNLDSGTGKLTGLVLKTLLDFMK